MGSSVRGGGGGGGLKSGCQLWMFMVVAEAGCERERDIDEV